MAWLRGISESKDGMYIRWINAINAPFKFQTAQMTADEEALLDSRATKNFMDEKAWERLDIGRHRLPQKIKVFNVDGTENRSGEMTYYCRLHIIYDGKEDLQDFYITNLGKDHIILGYPFLKKFNPQIDWKEGKLNKPLAIQSTFFKRLDTIVNHWQKKAQRLQGLEPGDAVYIRKTSTSWQMNEDYYKKQEPVKEPTIPEEYRQYASVFSEEESKQFPPNREPNATIQLKEGAPAEINCKVYPLTRPETQTLKEFIEKELKKGYISEAASPYTSPVFFIAKKNHSEKQLVINY